MKRHTSWSFSLLPLLWIISLFGAPAQARQEQTAPPATITAQQQTPPSAPAQPAPQQSQTAAGSSDQKKTGQTNGTSNDRLFGVLPNFLTLENAGKIPPLTTGQKFKVVARSTFDPAEFAYIAFLSGLSQAQNSEPGYGQGLAGYGKRYGAAFADTTDENFMTGAIFPSLLHQDPRYFQLGKGTFLHRAGYAVSRIFITRTDSGHAQFNYSEILGSAVSAGISTTYHPAGDRTFGNTMSIWWTQVGWDSATYVVKEFWPDIRRKFLKAKEPPANPPPPVTSANGTIPQS
jgi:hypothetical protein